MSTGTIDPNGGGKAAKTPVATEVRAGTPRLHEGMLLFDDAHHPQLDGARQKFLASESALHKKINSTPAATKEMEEARQAFFTKNSARAEAASKAGNQRALDALQEEANAAVRSVHQKHAAAELQTYTTAHGELQTVERELRALQATKVKGMKVEDIAGYAHNKEYAQSAVDALHKEVTATKAFGIARTEGIVAAVDHNIGVSAWKKSAGKAALHSVGFLGGVAMVGDAVARSETKGADGTPQKRSVLGRWTEAVVGAGLAATSALHGRR